MARTPTVTARTSSTPGAAACRRARRRSPWSSGAPSNSLDAVAADGGIRVFLDVDGVLNAVPGGHEWWDDWRTGRARPHGGMGYKITWSPRVASYIAGLDDRSEVMWLTTWEDQANSWISPMLGLPEWPVAGYNTDIWTPGWWKLDVVRKWWENDGRPFVWLDDDIDSDYAAREWLAGLPEGSCLYISPLSEAGLLPADLELIEAFVGEMTTRRHR